MKIKVGQWVRTKTNIITKVIDVDEWNKKPRYWYKITEDFAIADTEDNLKVANTPQELVQVGDLVEAKGNIFIPIRFYQGNGKLLVSGWFNLDGEFISLNDITAIYTPNKDRTQYTEQWRK